MNRSRFQDRVNRGHGKKHAFEVASIMLRLRQIFDGGTEGNYPPLNARHDAFRVE